MDNKKIENEIKNNWFKNHVATVTKEGDMIILTWRRPNDSTYYMKYIFDGCMMYISGDVGYAMFRFTCNGSPYADWSNTYLGYFLEKMVAFSDERYDFNVNEAVKALIEWKRELVNDEIKFDIGMFNELIDACENCESKRDWVDVVNDSYYNDFISDLHVDYWEWIYNIGDEAPARLRSYLIGLQMASEQLNENKVKEAV